MTLAQIMKLALQQLDEDPEDVGEYEELFRVYANTGYAIAVRGYLHPRELRTLTTDGEGSIRIAGMDIERVIELTRLDEEECRREAVPFTVLPDGQGVHTPLPEARFEALCEVRYPELTKGTDEPRLPEHAHAALADYICYRYMSCGSLARQNRAKFFMTSFYQAMQQIASAGSGSLTEKRYLYEATRLRTAMVR